MDIKTTLDGTPLMVELFKTQAYIRTLASTLLTDEQKDQFNSKYGQILKEIVSDFLEDNPGLVSDEDNQLRDYLSDPK